MSEAPTCAVFIGASRFPRHKFPTEPAFLKSKDEVESCVLEDAALLISGDSILSLFNSDDTASEQLTRIRTFLLEFGEFHKNDIPRNLIIYYVGHGYFYGKNQEYMVALASTESENGSSGLRVSDLADVIKKNAKEYRRLVILDCCFAAEALAAFQGDGEHVVARKASQAFATDSVPSPRPVPIRGTALLCASSKDDGALSLGENGCTMFGGALVESIKEGGWTYGPRLTTSDLFDLIETRLNRLPGGHVRPELHSPDQKDGDIATSVGLFANRAFQQNDGNIFNSGAVIGTYFGPTQKGHFVRQEEIFLRPTEQNLGAILAILVSFLLYSVMGHAPNSPRSLGFIFVPMLVFSCCIFGVLNAVNFVQAVLISGALLAFSQFVDLLFDAPSVSFFVFFLVFAASLPVCAIGVLIIALLRPYCRRFWRNIKGLGRA